MFLVSYIKTNRRNFRSLIGFEHNDESSSHPDDIFTRHSLQHLNENHSQI